MAERVGTDVGSDRSSPFGLVHLCFLVHQFVPYMGPMHADDPSINVLTSDISHRPDPFRNGKSRKLFRS